MSTRASVRFIADLFDHGRIVLDGDEQPGWDDLDAMSQALVEFELIWRPTLSDEPPALSPAAAMWAGEMLYSACQMLTYRELGEDEITKRLTRPCPEQPSPEVCYSVDLTFRFLPDLTRIARAAADEDPLVTQLLQWATDWPLSSVGIKGISDVDVEPFIHDRCLRTTYVDRVIAKSDTSRLEDEGTIDALRETIGGFPELAPEFQNYLSSGEPTSVS